MMDVNLKVNDSCFVQHVGIRPAKVVAVGRKWIRVRTENSGEYEFDRVDHKARGHRLGYIPGLLTVEQHSLLQAQKTVDLVLKKLEKHFRKCRDSARLESMFKAIEKIMVEGGPSDETKVV
jgi:ABC-type Mn2+/Zn2+ transport system ATPase subunit